MLYRLKGKSEDDGKKKSEEEKKTLMSLNIVHGVSFDGSARSENGSGLAVELPQRKKTKGVGR
jgi:hypothetical protein